MQEHLAVLPVGHRGARFERLVAGRLRHEGLVDDEGRLLEPFLDVAEGPFVGRLAHRHLIGAGLGEVLVGPFPDRDLRRRGGAGGSAAASASARRCSGSRACCGAGGWRPAAAPAGGAGGCGWCRTRCAGRAGSGPTARRGSFGGRCALSGRLAAARCRARAGRGACAGAGGVRAACVVGRAARAGRCRRRRRTHPDVALHARVRPAGPQAFNRIDDEGERFELDDDRFDRQRRGELVDGGDGEDRLALIERLVGQAALGLRARLHAFAERGADGGAGHVVGGQDRLDAGHRQRGARVEARHPRVRVRADEQFREQHAFDAVVLGVFRLAGDLGDEVGGGVVLADQLVVSHHAFLMCSAPFISAVRILS